MNAGAEPELLLQPEAIWAQVTFLIPVIESSPETDILGAPPWRNSVAEFELPNEQGKTTDRAWRSAHISAAVRATLYDHRLAAVLDVPVQLGQLRRTDGRLVALTARQLEFLPTGIAPGFGPGGILIVHTELDCSPSAGPRVGQGGLPVRWLASSIKDLARAPFGELPGANKLVSSWGLSIDPEADILAAANLVPSDATLAALLARVASADAAWTALTAWAWSLARGTVPSRSMLRAPAPPATPGRTIALPNRIAVVDRAGVALIGVNAAERDPDLKRSLAEFIPVFQSVYTDVLALGCLQLLVTSEVGARLDALADPVDQPGDFHRIESRMRILHNRFWSTRISEWPWLDGMLRAFQEENELPAVVSQLSKNISDFGDQVERHYQHGLNTIVLLLGALGLLGVIAGVFAAVAAFMSVFGTGHWGAVVGILATSVGALALIGGAALLLRRGPGRELVPYLRRRG